MKYLLKVNLIAIAFTTLICLNAYADGFAPDIATVANLDYAKLANTNITNEETYTLLSNAIRLEIDVYNNQIKELNIYNQSVNAKLKDLEQKYKTDKNIISNEDMKKVRELRKSLKTYSTKEKTITEDNSIKNLVQNKEYEKALEKLNLTLDAKKEQLKSVQYENAIWHQIDALIG